MAERAVDESGTDRSSSGIDLLVVEGRDAGKRFTFDSSEVLIGSDLPPGAGIELCDPSISPRHAVLRTHRDAWMIELLDPLASPLHINDLERARGIVRPGDRVQIGRVLLQISEHEGLSLRGILQMVSARRDIGPATDPTDATGSRTDPTLIPAFGDDADSSRTLLRPVSLVTLDRGHLNVLQGASCVGQERFELGADVTTIGRAAGSDIAVGDRTVSRAHAELVWEDGALVLIQRSPTNYTFVNGERVSVSRRLREGDKIQIADVLVLQVEGLPERGGLGAKRTLFRDLGQAMEARLQLERQIEAEFLRRGSMLDVDVAGSSEMKQPDTSPAHIILSFERFRDFVASTVREFDGKVLNSNGDELMCFFEDTYAAVRAGSAILQRLDRFNRKHNLLPQPFRFRIGIHTGDCLVDLVNGRAFSSLVDLAGHLQKEAPVNGLLVSQETLAALPPGLPFEPAGELERHGIRAYRLVGFLE